jgi:3-oxoadipate CoA-transferase beta subunit
MSTETKDTRLLTRDQMARRAAAELADGWLVNIGIGMPTLVLPHVPADRDVIFHSENGIVGLGPAPADPADYDPDLMTAGKKPASLIPGAAIVHHADSFAIVRGGRLDAAVLGAFQVAENGDLANWKLLGAKGGSVGGAMDIAVGAKQVLVMMTHVTKDGEPKVVTALSYPVTARNSVTKIFTDMAVIAVTADGLVLDELAPGITADEVQAATVPNLRLNDSLKEITV